MLQTSSPGWLSHRTTVTGRSAEQQRTGTAGIFTPSRREGAKSFVDDLVLGRGVVLSRAATSLRSIETQPWTRRFVRCRRTCLRLPPKAGSRWFPARLRSAPLRTAPLCLVLLSVKGVAAAEPTRQFSFPPTLLVAQPTCKLSTQT